jgi:hypothetical protein
MDCKPEDQAAHAAHTQCSSVPQRQCAAVAHTTMWHTPLCSATQQTLRRHTPSLGAQAHSQRAQHWQHTQACLAPPCMRHHSTLTTSCWPWHCDSISNMKSHMQSPHWQSPHMHMQSARWQQLQQLLQLAADTALHGHAQGIHCQVHTRAARRHASASTEHGTGTGTAPELPLQPRLCLPQPPATAPCYSRPAAAGLLQPRACYIRQLRPPGPCT